MSRSRRSRACWALGPALAALAFAAAACKETAGPAKGVAEGIVEIERVPGRLPGPGAPAPGVSREDVGAAALRIKSDRVLATALGKLEGKQPSRYAGPDGWRMLGRDLVVDPVPDTRCIAVRLGGADRFAAALILREVLDAFIRHVEAEEREVESIRREWLRQERDELAKQIQISASVVSSLRQELGMAQLGVQADEHAVRLARLTEQLASAQTNLAGARAALEQFRELQEKKDSAALLAACPALREALEGHPLVRGLREEVARQELELAKKEAAAGDAKVDSAVLAARTALAAIQKTFAEKRERILEDLAPEHLAALGARCAMAAEVESSLRDQMSDARRWVSKAAEGAAMYRDAEREHLRLCRQLDALKDRMDRMQIEGLLAGPPVRVIQWPTAPLD